MIKENKPDDGGPAFPTESVGFGIAGQLLGLAVCLLISWWVFS